jgi:hypothetical protein
VGQISRCPHSHSHRAFRPVEKGSSMIFVNRFNGLRRHLYRRGKPVKRFIDMKDLRDHRSEAAV